MFKDRYHPAVKKDLRKIDKAVREKIKKVWIPKLLLEPDEGKELTGSLSGIRSYHLPSTPKTLFNRGLTKDKIKS